VKEVGAFFGRGILFLLKCIVLTVVFWGIYLQFIRPFFYGNTDPPADANQKKVQENFAVYEAQMKRSEALLTRQEEIAKRMEAVVSSWEKSSKGGSK
jgi:zona occludens toxin (predicted ATPase)